MGSHLFQRVASFLQGNVKGNVKRQQMWFSSLSESGFIPTDRHRPLSCNRSNNVLISFREWLHSYLPKYFGIIVRFGICSHLFQRVASFLLMELNRILAGALYEMFSSLSESGFIPTCGVWSPLWVHVWSVLISFREWLHSYLLTRPPVQSQKRPVLISFREWLHSYSESYCTSGSQGHQVLISFREWLHSYMLDLFKACLQEAGSHLFQRVASFLPGLSFSWRRVYFHPVLISFREWLHSYCWRFIYQTVMFLIVLISFREWLHSYRSLQLSRPSLEDQVLISFREWLHSYEHFSNNTAVWLVGVLISFREWLHSYKL